MKENTTYIPIHMLITNGNIFGTPSQEIKNINATKQTNNDIIDKINTANKYGLCRELFLYSDQY